jgi:hypothetical protein
MHMGWYQALQGNEAGIATIRESIEVTRGIGMLNPIGTMLTVLADAQFALGQDEDALATLDDCADVFRTNICRHHEPYAHLLRARVVARAGDLGGAETNLRTAIRMADGQGAGLFELHAAVELVRMLCANAAVPEAVSILRAAREKFDETTHEPYAREADELLAGLEQFGPSGGAS